MNYTSKWLLIFLIFIQTSSFCQLKRDTISFVAKVLIIDFEGSTRTGGNEAIMKCLILVNVTDSSRQVNHRAVLRFFIAPIDITIKEGVEYKFTVKVSYLSEPEKRHEYKNPIKEYVLRENSEYLYEIISF